MMQFLMGVARFTLSAWVGAAVLFVVVSVQEVAAVEFDSTARDLLVALRFPSYYLFGFVLVGAAFVALATSVFFAGGHKRRQFALASALLFVLLVMLVDYFWVYSPLLEMITPPGKSRPASFLDYHTASKWVNFFVICLCAVVAIITCGVNKLRD